MDEAVIVKKVTLLDVYNELQELREKELKEIKENQDDLCRKIGEYNGLHERMDEFDLRCKFNLEDNEGLYHRLDERIVYAENVLKKTEYLDEGKGLYSKKITTTIFFIIAIIGGLSGLIALSKSLIQMLQ